ncbi:MAG: DUF5916 domain-containing protein, partial [Acidobacteriota bacterium]
MGRVGRLARKWAIGLWMVSTVIPCAAQETQPTTVPSRPSLHIRRIEKPPVIDGKIDDPAWADAPVIRDFTQVEPVEGAPPTEQTELLVTYDSDFLYIAIRCFDSQPELILGKQMQKDGNLNSDDSIEIAIDTFRDRRNGYQFQTSPAGARGDGLIEPGGEVRDDWDGIWEVRTYRDDKGWYVEMKLPFKTVSFDSKIDTWGFNIERTIRRKQEKVRWASPRNNIDVSDVGEAGDLIGLSGLRQGHGLTLKPFVATKLDLTDGGDSTKPGFDLFYQVTPSITAALTVNTDFAETEVDERRVNLTRFPLFFPEKRDFFLQDAGIFAFGGIEQSPLPFHSRRIGIVGGEEKDILAGLKVTGRQDRLSFGLLDVQMKDDDELGNKNLSVARATLNVLEESTVGMIGTYGDPSTTGDNTLVGADFNFRTSRIFGDEVLQGNAWIMGTQSSDDRGSDTAFGARIEYPNDTIAFELAANQVGEDFNPALGFVRRRGVREYSNFIRYRNRWDAYIRTMDIQLETGIFTGLDNNLQTLEGTWPQIEFENRFGDQFGFGLEHEIDNPDEDFDITDDIIIPAGNYGWTSGFVFFETTEARPISLEVRYSNGQFYDGDRQDYEVGVTWRPSQYFTGGVTLEINDIHLPQGDFIVRVIEGRADFQFSPDLVWSNIIQYDSESAELGLNSRVRWEVMPGQEV